MPVDSADTLRVKNFVEIALSRSVSEINTFLYFTQKFKTAAKCVGKTIVEKSQQYTLQIPCGSKISSKSLSFQDKSIFAFKTEIQDGHQKWRKKDF